MNEISKLEGGTSYEKLQWVALDTAYSTGCLRTGPTLTNSGKPSKNYGVVFVNPFSTNFC